MFRADTSDFDPDARVCPECGSEFQPHIEACIDCGAATVPASAMAGRELPVPEQSLGNRFSLPVESEVVCVRSGSVESAEDLGMFLERNGVPCRLEIEEPEDPPALPWRKIPPIQFQVLVSPASGKRRVLGLLKKYDQAQIRDTGMQFQKLPPPGWCPFCKLHLGKDVEWCPKCGLNIGEGEERTGAEDSG